MSARLLWRGAVIPKAVDFLRRIISAVNFSWFLALALLVWGCATQRSLQRQNWNHQEGVEALIGLTAADLQWLRDLKAEARITYQQAGQKNSGTAVILFKNPDLLKIEVRGPLYSHVFTALLQADSLTILSGEGAWKGAAQGSLLWRLTEIDFGSYDLKYAILGLVEPGRIDSNRAREYPRADRVIVPLWGSAYCRRLWIDLQRGFISREEITFADGNLLLSRELKDYQEVGGIYLPRQVEIHQGEVDLILEYQNYLANRGIPDEHFTRDIPQGRLQRVE